MKSTVHAIYNVSGNRPFTVTSFFGRRCRLGSHVVFSYLRQILMTELDPALMTMFSTSAYTSAEELTSDIGLTDLVPGAILDPWLFEPCGYSLNAIVKVVLHRVPDQH